MEGCAKLGLGNCGGSVNESLSLDRKGSIGTLILDTGQEGGKGKEGAGGGGEEKGECKRKGYERRKKARWGKVGVGDPV